MIRMKLLSGVTMSGASDIAAAAAGLDALQTAVQAQVKLLDEVMETQAAAVQELLKLLGVGQNLDFTA